MYLAIFFSCILAESQLNCNLIYPFSYHNNFYCWTLDVSWTEAYEITLVRPSVRPSVCLSVCPSVRPVRPPVCPSLSSFKIGSLVVSDIVHDDNWPWYLVTDEARYLKRNSGSPNLGPTSLNRAQNEVFHHFLEFELFGNCIQW